MGFFGVLQSMFTGDANGGVAGKIIDTVKDYFPPDMSDEEKANLNLAITQAIHKQEMDILNAAHEEEVEFNKRTVAMEGTAQDLIQAGWLGKIALFFRGFQRILWSYGIFVFDVFWLMGKVDFPTTMSITDPNNSGVQMIVPNPIVAFIVTVNVLVLAFLFGERALKNLTPMIVSIIGMFTGRSTNIDGSTGIKKKSTTNTPKG